jgi:hypothetical protein
LCPSCAATVRQLTAVAVRVGASHGEQGPGVIPSGLQAPEVESKLDLRELSAKRAKGIDMKPKQSLQPPREWGAQGLFPKTGSRVLCAPRQGDAMRGQDRVGWITGVCAHVVM